MKRTTYRPRQMLQSIRKETPGAMVDPDSHDVVLMLAAFGAVVPSTLSFESLGEAIVGSPQTYRPSG